MIRFDLISGETRKWREFFSGFVLGDECTFPAKDYKEVETIRSAAHQYNLRENKDFRITVKSRPSESPIYVTVKTEAKDGLE